MTPRITAIADDEEVVAHRRDQAGHQAPGAPEALDDEGVEAAGVHELLRHLRVADGEEQQHDRHQEERDRGPSPVAQRDHEGGHHDDAGQRRDGREHQEHDASHAERVRAQPRVEDVVVGRAENALVRHIGSRSRQIGAKPVPRAASLPSDTAPHMLGRPTATTRPNLITSTRMVQHRPVCEKAR
ncbi:hypothetical protein [Saccharopolyspora sp. NPDC002376]